MKIEAPNKRLKELQALPLERKVGFTIARITEWHIYYKGNVYISFSGDKASIVLLYISKLLYPDICLMYIDLSLDSDKVKEFIKKQDNVDIVMSENDFKDKPLDIAQEEKRKLSKQYEKETGYFPIIGSKTEDSKSFKSIWLKNGCNMFDGRNPESRPMSFWKDYDVFEFIKIKNIETGGI